METKDPNPPVKPDSSEPLMTDQKIAALSIKKITATLSPKAHVYFSELAYSLEGSRSDGLATNSEVVNHVFEVASDIEAECEDIMLALEILRNLKSKNQEPDSSSTPMSWDEAKEQEALRYGFESWMNLLEENPINNAIFYKEAADLYAASQREAAQKESDYWKERCRLAEILLEVDYPSASSETVQAQTARDKFIKENGERDLPA